MREITDREFGYHVLENPKPAVVIVGTRWCADTLRMVNEVIPDFEARHGRSVDFFVLYAEDLARQDENPETRITHRIFSYPTILLFQKGALVAKRVSEGSAISQTADLDWSLSRIRR